MEIKQDFVYKGTRILFDKSAKNKRDVIDKYSKFLYSNDFKEIIIPIIQFQTTFANKVGSENNNMMYNFQDRGNRDICLAPEYTAIIQQLANTQFKYQKDVKVFYIAECFRGEKPQTGRYRQFTQLGVEIVNPTKDYSIYLTEIAKTLIEYTTTNYILNTDVTRGLDYYKNGKGFEISVNTLGAQKQVCGGGEYNEGIGFAIGVDRILLI